MGVLYKTVVAPSHANCAVIQEAVQAYIEKARRIFGEAAMSQVSEVLVEFFSRGKNIAIATYGLRPDSGKKVGVIQFSFHHVVRKLVVMLKQIVPHELAHVICMVNGWDMGHGKVWRQVCMMLGGNGETFSTLGYVDGRMKNLYEAHSEAGAIWLNGQQRKLLMSGSTVEFETSDGTRIMLTRDSLTGNIKPL